MYLFIAYKPDSDDYCRGCRMASYSADFISANHLAEDQLVSVWADVLFKNLNLDYNEAGYEIQVYDNGVKVWDGNYSCCDSPYDEDMDDDEVDKRDREYVERIAPIHDNAVTEAQRLQNDKKEKEALAAAAKRQIDDQAMAEQRRQQYEKLKKEFEA